MEHLIETTIIGDPVDIDIEFSLRILVIINSLPHISRVIAFIQGE